jgi:hypothetical protein
MSDSRRDAGRRFGVRALVLTLLALSATAFSQIDIPITQIGPRRTITTNAVWNASGTGGLENNFIFTPAYTNETACVYVTNTDTASHELVLMSYATGNTAVTAYENNTQNWQLLGPTFTSQVNAVGFQNVLAGQTVALFSQVQNAARIALVFSAGTGSTATATVTLVESQNGYGCGNVPVGPVYCPIFLSQQILSAHTSTVLPAASGEAPYVCSFSFSMGTADSAAALVEIELGTGTNCATLFGIPWQVDEGPTSPLFISALGPSSGLVTRYSVAGDSVGQGLCVVNNTSNTIYINLTMAQF